MKGTTDHEISFEFPKNFYKNFTNGTEKQNEEYNSGIELNSISNFGNFYQNKKSIIVNSLNKSNSILTSEKDKNSFLKNILQKDLNKMKKYSFISESEELEPPNKYSTTKYSYKKESNIETFFETEKPVDENNYKISATSEYLLSNQGSTRRFVYQNERAKKNWAKLRMHILKLKFGMKASSLVSVKHSQTLSGYNSKKNLVKVKYNVCLFSYKNTWIKNWNKLIVLLYIHFLFIIPERIAAQEKSPNFEKYCLAVDIIHMVDILLQLTTEKKTSRGIIRTHHKIFIYHLKNFLVFDFLGCLPLFLINKRFLKIKLFKLIRVAWFFKKMSSMIYVVASRICWIFLQRKELEMFVINFAREAITSNVFIYWLAHIFGTSFEDVSKNGINANKYNTEDQATNYLNSCYWMVITLAQVGYDGFANTGEEMLFMILVMFFGICLFGFVMGIWNKIMKRMNYFTQKLTETKENIDQWLLKRENSNKIRTLPNKLSEIIKSYVIHLDMLNFSGALYYLNILDKLRPDIIKKITNIKMNHIFEIFSQFFKNMPFDMRLKIVSSFQTLIIPENTLIIQRGQMPKGIYLIIEGKCFVTCLKGLIFCKLKKGNYFGDSCLFREKSPYFFVSNSKNSLICLFVPYNILKNLEKDYVAEMMLLKFHTNIRYEYYFDLKRNAKDRQSYFNDIRYGRQTFLENEENDDEISFDEKIEDNEENNCNKNEKNEINEENNFNNNEKNEINEEKIEDRKNLDKFCNNEKLVKSLEENTFSEENDENNIEVKKMEEPSFDDEKLKTIIKKKITISNINKEKEEEETTNTNANNKKKSNYNFSRKRNRGITFLRQSTNVDPRPKRRHFISFMTEVSRNIPDEEDEGEMEYDENEEILNYIEIPEKLALEEELIYSEDEPYFMKPEFESDEEIETKQEKIYLEGWYLKKKIACLTNKIDSMTEKMEKDLFELSESAGKVNKKYNLS